MTTRANTRQGLASRTSSAQCALPAQNSSFATRRRSFRTLHRNFLALPISFVHHQRRKNYQQKLSVQVRALFNTHNYFQHHRGHDACGFLLTS